MVNNQWNQGCLWTNTHLKVEIITTTIHGFLTISFSKKGPHLDKHQKDHYVNLDK
jgi:hypothetical protein